MALDNQELETIIMGTPLTLSDAIEVLADARHITIISKTDFDYHERFRLRLVSPAIEILTLGPICVQWVDETEPAVRVGGPCERTDGAHPHYRIDLVPNDFVGRGIVFEALSQGGHFLIEPEMFEGTGAAMVMLDYSPSGEELLLLMKDYRAIVTLLETLGARVNLNQRLASGRD